MERITTDEKKDIQIAAKFLSFLERDYRLSNKGIISMIDRIVAELEDLKESLKGKGYLESLQILKGYLDRLENVKKNLNKEICIERLKRKYISISKQKKI